MFHQPAWLDCWWLCFSMLNIGRWSNLTSWLCLFEQMTVTVHVQLEIRLLRLPNGWSSRCVLALLVSKLDLIRTYCIIIFIHHAVQYCRYYIHRQYTWQTAKYASNEKTQGVGHKYGGFQGSVCMGIPWGFPQVSLWVWDGYGDWNPIPTHAINNCSYARIRAYTRVMWVRLKSHHRRPSSAQLQGAVACVLQRTNWTTARWVGLRQSRGVWCASSIDELLAFYILSYFKNYLFNIILLLYNFIFISAIIISSSCFVVHVVTFAAA